VNQRQRVEFFGRELERAKRDFPLNSNEVHVAEVAYQAALTAAESEEEDARLRN